ncbi:hypothetical protein [Streptomyces fuscichromogenes]|uniref:Uncharacterized protein n=1 Tax=Streptomyces fuscichromogenes TaxID=1324013 RepID=A0A917XAD9_9ACTN|nr:hypothetical protein [Streptomyces fuscichromogenes]GGN01005.1 hypothetical protein GCM10011578_022860 [Streptomyces fuscichromogenes]
MLTSPAPRPRPARTRHPLTGNARILEFGTTRTGPHPSGPRTRAATREEHPAPGERHLVAPRMKPL